jgi:hypothetical protein
VRGCREEGLQSWVPEERHRGGEVGWGGEDGVPWGTCRGCVEEEVGGEETVDCACFWKSAGERFGD